MIKGIDILVLLKMSVLNNPLVRSKTLAEELFLSENEVSESIKRARDAQLLSVSDLGKRVNRSGLLEFLVHGFRYVFPAQMGPLTRGVPTGVSTAPLKAKFMETREPPYVWAYGEGTVRGTSIAPLHRRVPQAALRDPKLYELLALADAARGSRVRERQLAKEELTSRLGNHG